MWWTCPLDNTSIRFFSEPFWWRALNGFLALSLSFYLYLHIDTHYRLGVELWVLGADSEMHPEIQVLLSFSLLSLFMVLLLRKISGVRFKGCRRHSATGVWQTWIKLWAFYLLLRRLWANRWVPKWNSVTKAHGKPTNFVFLLIYFIPSAINKGWQIELLGQHNGQCRTISQEVPVS